MKLSTLVLTGSLAANAVLLGMVVVGSSADSGSAARLPGGTAATAKTSARGNPDSPGPEAWAGLQADDLARQRDRLRAAGFPPEIVRAILSAQVQETFAARRKAIEQPQGETPFWKDAFRDPKMQTAMRDLYREQEKIIKELLGRDARNDDPTYVAYLHRQFGNLPDEKVDQLRQILDDYNQRRSDIFIGAGNGGILPEERQKLADLDKAMHADLASAMTPDEFTEYNLRSSNTAQQLRFSLAAFDASEQEYRAIFQIQQAFDEKYGRMYGGSSQEEMKARMEAQKQLTEDIKTALGPDRATDYQRATDYSYRQTSQLVARLELPPETANQIYSMQKDMQQRAQTLQRDSSLSRDDRSAQLGVLAMEAQTKLTTSLGQRGYDAYKQNNMGQWLQMLQPRPAIPPPRN